MNRLKSFMKGMLPITLVTLVFVGGIAYWLYVHEYMYTETQILMDTMALIFVGVCGVSGGLIMGIIKGVTDYEEADNLEEDSLSK